MHARRVRTARSTSIAVLTVLVLGVVLGAGFRAAAADAAADIVVFAHEGCPRCAEAERFLATLGAEQPALRIERHDVVREPEAQARLRALLDRRRVRPLLVPSFLIGDELVIGFKAGVSEQEIRTRLAGAAGRGGGAALASPAPRTSP